MSVNIFENKEEIGKVSIFKILKNTSNLLGYKTENIEKLLFIPDIVKTKDGNFIYVVHHLGDAFKDKDLPNKNDRFIFEWDKKGKITLISKSPPRPVIKIIDLDNENQLREMLKNKNLEKRYEATVIRVFKRNNELFVTSARRIDLSKCCGFFKKNISHRTMFDEAVERQQINLNLIEEGESFTLLLEHPINQKINQNVVHPTLYYINHYILNLRKKTELIEDIPDWDRISKIGFKQLKKLTINEAIKDIHRGRTFIIEENGEKSIISTKEIEKKYEIRGNNDNDIYGTYVSKIIEGCGDEFLKTLPPIFNPDIIKTNIQTLIEIFGEWLSKKIVTKSYDSIIEVEEEVEVEEVDKENKEKKKKLVKKEVILNVDEVRKNINPIQVSRRWGDRCSSSDEDETIFTNIDDDILSSKNKTKKMLYLYKNVKNRLMTEIEKRKIKQEDYILELQCKDIIDKDITMHKIIMDILKTNKLLGINTMKL